MRINLAGLQKVKTLGIPTIEWENPFYTNEMRGSHRTMTEKDFDEMCAKMQELLAWRRKCRST